MFKRLCQIIIIIVCSNSVDSQFYDSQYSRIWDPGHDLRNEFEHIDWEGDSKLDMEERHVNNNNKLPTNPKQGGGGGGGGGSSSGSGGSIATPLVVTGEITSTTIEVFIVLLHPHKVNWYRSNSFYQLNYTTTDSTSPSRGIDVQIAGTRNTHVQLSGLFPGTQYRITVSIQLNGGGGPVAVIRARTRDSDMPRAPDIHVLRVTDTDVRLLLTLMPGSAPVAKYKLAFYDDHHNIDFRWIQVDKSAVDGGSKTTYLLDNLYPDRQYCITVASVIWKAVGASNRIVISTSPTVPFMVMKATTSESAVISVKPIVDGTNSPLFYRVVVLRTGRNNDTHINFIHHCQDIRTCDITIEDLLGHRTYSVEVSEKMDDVYGPAGVITFTTDPPTKPGPVRIISPFLSSKKDTYTLRWRRTTTGGSKITGYVIRYVKVKRLGDVWAKLHHHGPMEHINISNGDAYQYRITGLHPNWRYKVLMYAKNVVGNSFVTHFSFRTKR